MMVKVQAASVVFYLYFLPVYSFISAFPKNAAGLLRALSSDTILKSSALFVDELGDFLPEQPIKQDAWLQISVDAGDLDYLLPSHSQSTPHDAQLISEVFEAPKNDFSEPPSLVEYLKGSDNFSNVHLSKVLFYSKRIRRHDQTDKYFLKKFNGHHASLLREALLIAYCALWGQKAKTTEDAIERAVGVAEVLLEIKADMEVILAGILSDVFVGLQYDQENIEFIRERLSAIFGVEVMQLVEKYSRLPTYMSSKTDYNEYQAELQQQMLVRMTEDYRTLFIRLADRVHTMRVVRTLSALEDCEKYQIAMEAMTVYSPLAHKMGIMKFRGELEDQAFSLIDHSNFRMCQKVALKASVAWKDMRDDVQAMVNGDPVLRAQNVTSIVHARIKDKYQIFRKMKRKKLASVDDVQDALGLRVIIDFPRSPTESEEEYLSRKHAICYYIVEKIRSTPPYVATLNGFKDYILGAKANGYQSLHQYVTHTELQANVEVQVRTKEMHQLASLGDAAHFFYKDLVYRPDIANSKLYRNAWRSKLQSKSKSNAELFGLAKQQLASKVFVFKDDESTVMALPRGSTSLDAAFAIHTDLAFCTKMILVNGKPAGLKRPLLDRDVVSVHTSPELTVKRGWLDIVQTSYAQAKLRKYFRQNCREMVACIGILNLLMTITLNKPRIEQRHPRNLGSSLSPKTAATYPNATRLVQVAPARTGLDSLEEVVVNLGVTGESDHKTVIRSLVGSLLTIPANELEVTTSGLSLIWARKQERDDSWEDRELLERLLVPLLREMSKTMPDIESKWIELVGSKSLARGTEASATTVSQLHDSSTSPPSSTLDPLAQLVMKQRWEARIENGRKVMQQFEDQKNRERNTQKVLTQMYVEQWAMNKRSAARMENARLTRIRSENEKLREKKRQQELTQVYLQERSEYISLAGLAQPH